MSWVAWVSLFIALAYFLILILFIAHVIHTMINSQMNETIEIIQVKNYYNKMLDGLHEGICTIDDDNIIFMNELCHTLTSYLSDLSLNDNESMEDVDPLDRKIFFQYKHVSERKKIGADCDN